MRTTAEEREVARQQLRKHQSALYDNAVTHPAEVNRKAVDVSLDIGKAKMQYFEKLALGCGAAILAMASYIGGKPGIHLHPYWLPRAALVSLALGTCIALFRNWSFQAYTMAHWRRENVSAQSNLLRAEHPCMRESGGLDPCRTRLACCNSLAHWPSPMRWLSSGSVSPSIAGPRGLARQTLSCCRGYSPSRMPLRRNSPLTS